MTDLRQEEVANRMIATRYARRALAALAIAAGLAGAAHPALAAGEPSLQRGAQAVRDWDNAAVRFVNSMQTKGFIPSPVKVPGRTPFPPPYYINVTVPGSTFLEEVKQSIEWELLDRDLSVARSPVGATVINLDIDVVRWGGDVGPSTELVWRGSILQGGREMVKSSDILTVSRSDVPLYVGAGSLPPMTTPGGTTLGPVVQLRYAR
jgi:hypothetical protein